MVTIDGTLSPLSTAGTGLTFTGATATEERGGVRLVFTYSRADLHVRVLRYYACYPQSPVVETWTRVESSGASHAIPIAAITNVAGHDRAGHAPMAERTPERDRRRHQRRRVPAAGARPRRPANTWPSAATAAPRSKRFRSSRSTVRRGPVHRRLDVVGRVADRCDRCGGGTDRRPVASVPVRHDRFGRPAV